MEGAPGTTSRFLNLIVELSRRQLREETLKSLTEDNAKMDLVFVLTKSANSNLHELRTHLLQISMFDNVSLENH